jgi:arsenite methyltransferase
MRRAADSDEQRERVRERYARAAAGAAQSAGGQTSGNGGGEEGWDVSGFGSRQYSAGDRGDLPETAVAASLGCGNPLAVADLAEGETVLDLGSGGGIDVLLSARRVGPAGRAYGLDMTDEMLDLARANAAEAGAENVEFLKGPIEAIPLPAESVDVVISNCVIILSADKDTVFAETFRVLRDGGRLGVTDVVADDSLTPDQRAARKDPAGLVAGMLSFAEYRAGLAAVGFVGIEITPTHAVADGIHAAIIRAAKPAARSPESSA